MEPTIKTIEDLSLNAWPSHQIQVYDGWILRFSYFYTHRTNSVEQIGTSTLPLNEKIGYCEQIYKKWGTPAIFKITPLTDPALDHLLDARGYINEHITEVMIMNLENLLPSDPEVSLNVTRNIPDSWIQGLFTLKGTTNIMHRKVVPSMYHAIPMDTICVSVQDKGQIVATGLGILDREYIGIYAIHVHPDYRGRHYALAVCQAILSTAQKHGASRAYLQVVEGNAPARNLYEKIGFSFLYKYWFKVKNLY